VNQRQVNTRSILIGQELVEVCGNILDPSERQAAFEAFYEVCKRHLELFCLEQEQMQRRLRPMSN